MTQEMIFLLPKTCHKSENFFPFIQKVLKYQIYDAHMKSLQAVINCQFLHLFDVFIETLFDAISV